MVLVVLALELVVELAVTLALELEALGLALSLEALELLLPYNYRLNWLLLCCCDASIIVDNLPFLESSFNFEDTPKVVKVASSLLPLSTYYP